MRSCVLLVGLILACGGASVPVETRRQRRPPSRAPRRQRARATIDKKLGTLIAVGLYKACAVADPKTGKGGVIETDPAPAKKLFDSIFTTK